MILADHDIDESDIKMYTQLDQSELYKLYWNLIKLLQQEDKQALKNAKHIIEPYDDGSIDSQMEVWID